LDKNVIFRWFCIPEVAQQQTLGEVKKTERSLNSQLCREDCGRKLIKIW